MRHEMLQGHATLSFRKFDHWHWGPSIKGPRKSETGAVKMGPAGPLRWVQKLYVDLYSEMPMSHVSVAHFHPC